MGSLGKYAAKGGFFSGLGKVIAPEASAINDATKSFGKFLGAAEAASKVSAGVAKASKKSAATKRAAQLNKRRKWLAAIVAGTGLGSVQAVRKIRAHKKGE